MRELYQESEVRAETSEAALAKRLGSTEGGTKCQCPDRVTQLHIVTNASMCSDACRPASCAINSYSLVSLMRTSDAPNRRLPFHGSMESYWMLIMLACARLNGG